MLKRMIPTLLLAATLSLFWSGGAAAQDCEAAYEGIDTIEDMQEVLRRVEQYPQCGDLYVALGDIAYDQQLWLDAEKWYAKSLEFYPDDSFILDRRAECLRNKPIALDDADSVDVEEEIQKRGLGGAKGLPPMSLDINFDSGSAALKPEARASLDKFSAMAQSKFGEFRFEVQGHTDDVGSPKTNQELSKRRAEAVKQYLVQAQGMDQARLQVMGYGQSRPIASNLSEDGRARNRRVQFQGMK